MEIRLDKKVHRFLSALEFPQSVQKFTNQAEDCTPASVAMELKLSNRYSDTCAHIPALMFGKTFIVNANPIPRDDSEFLVAGALRSNEQQLTWT